MPQTVNMNPAQQIARQKSRNSRSPALLLLLSAITILLMVAFAKAGFIAD